MSSSSNCNYVPLDNNDADSGQQESQQQLQNQQGEQQQQKKGGTVTLLSNNNMDENTNQIIFDDPNIHTSYFSQDDGNRFGETSTTRIGLYNHDDSEHIILFEDPMDSPLLNQDQRDFNNDIIAMRRRNRINNNFLLRWCCNRTSSSANTNSGNQYYYSNGLNYLNFVSYIFGQLLISVGIGILWDFDTDDDNGSRFIPRITTTWDFLQTHDTLLNPFYWTYEYLWITILAWQGIFVCAQLFSYFSTRSVIQQQIGYLYFYISIFQTLYTFFCSTNQLFGFYYLSIIGSFVCICGVFMCLFTMLLRFSYYNNQSSLLSSLLYSSSSTAPLAPSTTAAASGLHSSSFFGTKRCEYWLFRFPFCLYCGWAIPMTLLHFTILFRLTDNTNHISLQLSANIVSITILFMMACIFAIFGGPPFSKNTEIAIPLVILWFFIGIACRLNQPEEDMLDAYGSNTISAIRDTIWFLSGTIICIVIPRSVIWAYHKFCTIHLVSLDYEEEDGF